MSVNTYICADCGRHGAVNFAHVDDDTSYCPDCFGSECEECGDKIHLDGDLWMTKGSEEINVGWDCCKEKLEAQGWVLKIASMNEGDKIESIS